jgi:hypothetical protein
MNKPIAMFADMRRIPKLMPITRANSAIMATMSTAGLIANLTKEVLTVKKAVTAERNNPKPIHIGTLGA